jgi:L-ascorbate metabolism protein UlaG (beta-lactamase superfamily)
MKSFCVCSVAALTISMASPSALRAAEEFATSSGTVKIISLQHASLMIEAAGQATVMKNGETKTIGGWKIEAVPMYNLKRGPAPGQLYHDKGRGNGYILTYGGKRFYFSGDTGNTPEMRALRNIDVAFVCMNLPYTTLESASGTRIR